MLKEDARTLPEHAQEEKRKQAIRLKLEGFKITEIAKMVGVRRQTIKIWISKYETEGVEGIKSKTRGRHLGDGRTLSPDQELKIQEALRTTLPENYGLEVALWDRRSVSHIIHEKFEIKMPIRTVGWYLKRWGFSPQRPKKKPMNKIKRP